MDVSSVNEKVLKENEGQAQGKSRLDEMLDKLNKGEVIDDSLLEEVKFTEVFGIQRIEPEDPSERDIECRVILSKEAIRVVEGGACDFYTIKLSNKPAADVMVQIDDPSGQVRTSPKVVRFFYDANERGGVGNWETEQIVRVMAVDDDNVELIRETAALTHCSLSGDIRFSSVNGRCKIQPEALPVNIVDNDGGFVFTFGEVSGSRDMLPVARPLRNGQRSQNGRKPREGSSVAVDPQEILSAQHHQPTEQGLQTPQSNPRSSTTTLEEPPVPEESIRTLSCGSNHIGLVLTDGRFMSLGAGGDGQLCHGDFRSRSIFSTWRSIDRDGILRSKITQVACGLAHTALVTDDGRLLMCGSNAKGQLGLCDGPNAGCTQCLQMTGAHHKPQKEDYDFSQMSLSTLTVRQGKDGSALETNTVCAVPRVVESLAHLYVERVACGESHTVVLVSTGSSNTDRGVVKCRIFGWGDGVNGALGGNIDTVQPHPIELSEVSKKDPFQISCGARFTAVLCGPGDLYTAGWNLNGCFGRRAAEDDPSLNSFALISVNGKKKEEQPRFVEITCGHSHLGVLTDDQNVYVCGNNESGQLGIGDRAYRSSLTKVNFLTGLGVSSLAFGMFHSCAATWEGDLYVWGSNDHGQLGLGAQVLHQDIPVLHQRLIESVKQVHSGKAFTALILQKSISKPTISANKAKIRQYQERVHQYWDAKREHERQKFAKKLDLQQEEQKRKREASKGVSIIKQNSSRRPERVVDAKMIREQATFVPYDLITKFTPRIIRRPVKKGALTGPPRPTLGGRQLFTSAVEALPSEKRSEGVTGEKHTSSKPKEPIVKHVPVRASSTRTAKQPKKIKSRGKLQGHSSPRLLSSTTKAASLRKATSNNQEEGRSPKSPTLIDVTQLTAEKLIELQTSIYGNGLLPIPLKRRRPKPKAPRFLAHSPNCSPPNSP